MNKKKILFSSAILAGVLTASISGTNVNAATGNVKTVGVYNDDLIPNKTVALYSLSDSDTTISINDIKAEFAGANTDSINGIVKTGDTFEVNGVTHTVVIYGDVNKDGRVTTRDALEVQKHIGGGLDELQAEAADVENDGNITAEDATAIQKFILKKRKTATGTIASKYPPISIDGISVDKENQPATVYCYDDITLGTVVSTNAGEITQEMLSATTITAPSGVDTQTALSYESIGNGKWKIKLYAPQAGTYTVTPAISGTGVKGGTITSNTQLTVTVVENREVTDIKLYDAQNNIITNNNVSVTAEEDTKPRIEFYHTYVYNGQVARQAKIDDITASDIRMSVGDASGVLAAETLMYNQSDLPVSWDQTGAVVGGAGSPITSIYVKATAVTGNAILTITSGSNVINIPVTVKAKPQVSGLTTNGTSAIGTTMNVDIYTYNPNINTVKDISGKVYTIIPLSKIYTDNSVEKLTRGVVGKLASYDVEGKIAISGTSTASFAIEHFAGNATSGYTQVTNANDEIDAIGIAINSTDPANDTAKVEAVANGFTLKYDGVGGRKSTTINVTIKEQPSTPNKAPSNDIPTDSDVQAPSTEENGTVQKAAPAKAAQKQDSEENVNDNTVDNDTDENDNTVDDENNNNTVDNNTDNTVDNNTDATTPDDNTVE